MSGALPKPMQIWSIDFWVCFRPLYTFDWSNFDATDPIRTSSIVSIFVERDQYPIRQQFLMYPRLYNKTRKSQKIRL